MNLSFSPIRLALTLVVMPLLAFGLAACNSGLPEVAPSAPSTATISPPPPAPPATATQAPTPTLQPPLAILLAAPGSDAGLSTDLQSLLAELTQEAGLQFEVRPRLEENALLNEALRLVIAISPDPGLAELAQAAPQVQFMAVGMPDVEPAGNLTVVNGQGTRPDQQGFIAGYLAAVITPDWRIAVISQADSLDGKSVRNGFLNGAIFFCGLCRPSFPPFVQYPVFYELPAGSGQADQQAAVDALVGNAVQTAYVFPGTGDENLLEALAAAEIKLIGGITPPADMNSHWVATIRADLLTTVRQAWDDLLKGRAGVALDAPLLITGQNTDLLSPGKQRLIEQTLQDLLAGYIETGVDPATGEP